MTKKDERTLEEFFADFTRHGRLLVEAIIDQWPHDHEPPKKEKMFRGHDGQPLFRARCYSEKMELREGMIIGDREDSISQEIKDALKEHFAGKPLGRSVEIQFRGLTSDRIPALIDIIVNE